jgi:NADPH-dependent 2,4-dienoyl-CoA reductase/sulfur reductase-like enzyme
MSTKVAVVGCTHAGTFATQSILSAHPDWEVHVFERNDTLSFLSCGIALWVGDHVSDPNKMFYSSPEALSELGAHMHMRTDVTSVDVAGKKLVYHGLEAGDEEERELEFDKLVITTGSKPVVPPIPGLKEGMDDERVLLCKNWDHGKYIKEHCGKAKSVIVIGAGYIGAELAEQLSEIGVHVTLIDGVDRVLSRTMDAPITDAVEQAYREHDVDLALGSMVSGFEHDADSVTVKTGDGSYTAEYAVLAIGFAPRTDLFTGQVEMLRNGAITVDEYQRVTIAGQDEPSQDVFAAGDSCTVLYNPTGKPDYIPLATNAVRQGLLVGANIVEPTAKYMGTQSTSAVQLYDLSLSGTGLTMGGCEARGIKADSVTVVEDYRPAFLLTTAPVTATLVWDPETRRVLGAQFLSTEPDVGQAANAVSIAIQAGFTIDQLAGVDLLFQPQFGQPVNYIGSVAMAACAK